MARHRAQDVFPAPLREFREEDWPPIPGECLGCYGCLGWAWGYEGECRPPLGEACGDRCYAAFPDQAADRRRRDALHRWRTARMGWLGEDHPAWIDEFVAWLRET